MVVEVVVVIVVAVAMVAAVEMMMTRLLSKIPMMWRINNRNKKK